MELFGGEGMSMIALSCLSISVVIAIGTCNNKNV